MTSATLSLPTTVTVDTAPRKTSFFARVMAAIIAARMRQAERDVARYKHLFTTFKVD